MSPDEIRRRLSRLRPLDFAGAEALARDLAIEAREPFSAFPKLLKTGDPTATRKVEAVLGRLGELGIMPRMTAAVGLSGDARMRLLLEAYRVLRELEERVSGRLRAALADRAVIPPTPDYGPVEVKVPTRRVCDEAYLLLHRLGNPDEPEEDYRRTALHFARLGESERDRAISALLEERPA